jgi:hypothetical protein
MLRIFHFQIPSILHKHCLLYGESIHANELHILGSKIWIYFEYFEVFNFFLLITVLVNIFTKMKKNITLKKSCLQIYDSHVFKN